MVYLVNITPLKAYMFGTDQKFIYPGEKLTGKESYYIKSNEVPEQTTILGLLRFLILKQKGILRSDFQYTKEERARMAGCIGAGSFSFDAKKEQDFGCIQEISPVFLMDTIGNYYIKNPFNNKEETQYAPMELKEQKIETSFGKIRLPENEEYNAKKGIASGYYNLGNGKVYKKIFSSSVLPGNRKNNKISDDDCFFKQEMIRMKAGFSFAVFVNVTEEVLPKKDIGYMGLGKSAFMITSKIVTDNDLAKRVEDAFAGYKGLWIYALSDLYIQGEFVYDKFCIVEKKQIRNLETRYDEKNHLRKLRRSEKQFNMVQKGSVFFKQCGLDIANENCQKIGYNKVVQLGKEV